MSVTKTDARGIVSTEQSIKEKRRVGQEVMLRDFVAANRKNMWAFYPTLYGKHYTHYGPDAFPSEKQLVATLRDRSKQVYSGNFAHMLRDLEHAEYYENMAGSGQMRSLIRPTARMDVPESFSKESCWRDGGYDTARRIQEARLERVYRTPLKPEEMAMRRLKSTLQAYRE